jgi:signal transduction histidine kinase
MLSTDLLERQLLDALPISAYVLDLDGRIVAVHQPATRFGREAGIPGARADDARDRLLWEVADDAFPKDQIQRAMLLLRTGRVPMAQWDVIRGHGDGARALLAQMTPLHDETHAVTGFVVSTTDVTASERAHEAANHAGAALAREIELDRIYQEVAHHIRQALRPDTIVIALVDAGDLSLAPRVAFHSGVDDDRRTAERRFAATWREALDRREVQTQRSDSAWALTAPLVTEGAPIGVISVSADDAASPEEIADARRVLVPIVAHLSAAIERARFIARGEYRQRIQVIGEIASGVAQELRNPIFGISSAAQLLRFRAREDPVMEKNVGRILREVERLNRMVTTLVELGRPMTLKRSTGDPDAVWDDVLEAERGRLESRAVAVHRGRARSAGSALIDAELLAQAFRSILSNAVEAAPEATDISLSSTALPNGWRCQLVNGGAPIPADVLPRVFDLFVSTKPGSTGTGLALARRIIEEHGGTIGIESAADTGTTVTITLPSAYEPALVMH